MRAECVARDFEIIEATFEVVWLDEFSGKVSVTAVRARGKMSAE